MSIMVQTTSEFKSVNPGTGVFAKVNQNVMSGVAMTNNARLSGTIYINGYATPQITTTLNNYRQSREEVVRAINMLGATPQDLMAILQAMKSAGALRADLEII